MMFFLHRDSANGVEAGLAVLLADGVLYSERCSVHAEQEPQAPHRLQ
jgi:hypothetical protein